MTYDELVILMYVIMQRLNLMEDETRNQEPTEAETDNPGQV
jgi:hypothetical protein